MKPLLLISLLLFTIIFNISNFTITNTQFISYSSNNSRNNNYYNTNSNANTNTNTNSYVSPTAINLVDNASSCVFDFPDGNKYDLTSIRNTQTDYTYNYAKYTYKANFCGTLVDKCLYRQSPAALFLKRSICVGALTPEWKVASQDYLDADIKTNGIKLNFLPGEKCYLGYNSYYKVSYVVACDPTLDNTKFITIKRINQCSLEYHFSSKYGCAISGNSLLGSKYNSKNILFYLFIISLVYLSVFSYINYKQNPEYGLVKAFPHRDFWRDFIDCSILGYKTSFNFTKIKMINIKNKVRSYKGLSSNDDDY